MLIFAPIKQFINSIKKLCLEIFIPNRKIRRILKGEMAKNYLKKYIKSLDCKTEHEYCKNNEIENYTIWQFWDSGAENAPDIVKRCIESIDKFEPDKRHIVLDLKNISEEDFNINELNEKSVVIEYIPKSNIEIKLELNKKSGN